MIEYQLIFHLNLTICNSENSKWKHHYVELGSNESRPSIFGTRNENLISNLDKSKYSHFI